MLRKLILTALLTVAALSAAQAATTAIAVTRVNLRAGPSTSYPAVTVVPTGAAITTFGCVAGYSWCDIGYGPYRGWVAANYLQVIYRGTPVVLTAPLAPAVGVTVVTFNRVYWDRHYVAYPWYGRWTAYPPYVAPRVTSAYRSADCTGGTCVGVRGATGIRGGSTAQTRVCTDGSCTSTRVTQGPNDGALSRTRNCSVGAGCTATRAGVGPNDRSFNGTRHFQR